MSAGCHQLIVGGPEPGIAGESPVTGSIHLILWLFNSHTHLKCFGLECHSACSQHGIDIASAMAGRQQDNFGRDEARTRADSSDATIGNRQILGTAIKLKLSSGIDHPLPDRLHHRRQPIRTKMRAMLVSNSGSSLALSDDPQDFTDVGTARPAGKFAVAESSGTPFAKQIVALGVQWAARLKIADIAASLAHFLAAFQYERVIAMHGQ